MNQLSSTNLVAQAAPELLPPLLLCGHETETSWQPGATEQEGGEGKTLMNVSRTTGTAGTDDGYLLKCFCKVVLMGKGHFYSACHQLTA